MGDPKAPLRTLDQPLDGPLQTFFLAEAVARLRGEKTYAARKVNSMTLHKGPGLRLVVVALHAGAKLDAHTAEGELQLLVVEGRVKVPTAAGNVTLEAGRVMTLHPGVEHSVEGLAESALLLTLSKP
jgi:quercetin dioxygenase-like cupin family protein